MNHKLLQSGQAILVAVIFFLIISVIIVFGFAHPILKQAKIASDLFTSKESFFLAEAGLEDVAYRITHGYSVGTSETVSLNNHDATITIDDSSGRDVLTTEGNFDSYFRKIRTELLIADGTSFHYGVQVGDRGLIMNNNSVVNGNIFSNGAISASNNARILGTAIVAEPNGISSGKVSGDVYAKTCSGSTNLMNIGVLHTNSAGNCQNYVSVTTSGLPVTPLPLPITDTEIDAWKNEAAAAGVINGNYILNGSGSLGPTKITGNLTINNGGILEVTGTIWVVGTVTISNGAIVRLDPDYGTSSGMIIADNTILLDNNSISLGSGEEGSYIMYVSTSDSLQAIRVRPGNTEAAIVYTNRGTIVVENDASLLEVVGYGINLQNNATISYEIGLENVIFASGPGGGWSMINWREIE